MLTLLQYCNYIIIVMQIKLMLLLLLTPTEVNLTCDRRFVLVKNRKSRKKTSGDKTVVARTDIGGTTLDY